MGQSRTEALAPVASRASTVSASDHRLDARTRLLYRELILTGSLKRVSYWCVTGRVALAADCYTRMRIGTPFISHSTQNRHRREACLCEASTFLD